MKEDKDIGPIIKNTLDGHEEPYIEGSWENFNLKQMHKRALLRRRLFTGIAAAVVITLTVAGLFYSSKEESVLNGKIAVIQKQPGTLEKPAVIAHNIEIQSEKDSPIKQRFNDPAIRDSLTDLLIENEMTKPVAKEEIKAPVNEPDNSTPVNIVPDKSTLDKTVPDRGVKEESGIGKTVSLAGTDFTRSNPGEKRVAFGLNVAPGVNTATDGSSFNISGGVSMDITIARNLEISTGVQLEYRDMVSESRNYDNMSAMQHTEYNMTNLDIPVNITWKFKNSRSESFYVSGGISSMAYLGENYSTTTFRQELQSSFVAGASGEENKVYKLVDVRTISTDRSEPFSSFDIAGRVNLMVGYSRAISPKLNLHVEPYLKIPVSGMGSRNMRFTTSGITCKISFR
jgi:hypothetical protein